MSENMRAVVYDKPFSVSVREVPKPTILHPDDVIVKGEQLHWFAFENCSMTFLSNDNMHLWKVKLL